MLGGLTPRHAAKRATGRDKLVQSLSIWKINRIGAATRLNSLASYDLSWMWSELGIAERRV